MTQNAVAHSLATVAQKSAHSSGQSSLHRSGEEQVNVAKDPLAHLAEHRLQGQLRKPPQPSGVALQSASVHSRGVQTVVHTPNFAPGALAHTPSWPFVPQQLTLLRQTCPSALHGLAFTSRRPASVRTTVARRTRPSRAACFIGHLLGSVRDGSTTAPVPPASSCLGSAREPRAVASRRQGGDRHVVEPTARRALRRPGSGPHLTRRHLSGASLPAGSSSSDATSGRKRPSRRTRRAVVTIRMSAWSGPGRARQSTVRAQGVARMLGPPRNARPA